MADLLGLELEAGRRIEMTSVGGSHTVAYVHELRTRFDDGIVLDVPFAIADTETVPNLLGRFGVFENLQIDFDASLQETRVTAPWLDHNGQRIWRFMLETERHIRERWKDIELPPSADKAASQMISRGAQLLAAAAGLAKLHRAFAGPLIIRAMFELALQFEYLMRDPGPRGRQYLDFAHVTGYRWAKAVAEKPSGPISEYIAASPLRSEGEARIKAKFERVRHQFRRGKTHLWNNWYCMTVKRLAEELEWDGEYRFWYNLGSVWAHTDPFGAEQTSAFPGIDSRVIMLACQHYYARMLLRVADKLILTAEQYEFLKTAAQEFS